jgi:hypothetical protein
MTPKNTNVPLGSGSGSMGMRFPRWVDTHATRAWHDVHSDSGTACSEVLVGVAGRAGRVASGALASFVLHPRARAYKSTRDVAKGRGLVSLRD